MPQNDFLPFATAPDANVSPQSEYAALALLRTGFSSGVARSLQMNKVWRQSSIMSAVLAAFIVEQSGQAAVDDGTTATLKANLLAAINGAVSNAFASKIGLQQDLYTSAIATGTADAIVAAFSPVITSTTLASATTTLTVRATAANATTAPTFTPNSGVVAAATIVKGANQALTAGDIAGVGHWITLQWDATLSKWVLLNPATGVAPPVEPIQSLATPTVLSGALTLAWNPAPLQFRNTSLSSGTPISMAAPGAALPITIPSGATLGTLSGVTAQIAHLIAYNGGSPVSCVVNMAGGVDLSETGLISPAIISSSSTSANAIYSASYVAANSPYRVVGYYTVLETTAGTWATSPAVVVGAGGEAMASLQSFGMGQHEIDLTGSRAINTTYYNPTPLPILVNVALVSTAPNQTASIMTNGMIFYGSSQTVTGYSLAITQIVRPGQSYSVPPGNYTIAYWREIR